MTTTESGRQFCRKCLRSAVPAVTLTFDGGTRRLHWCPGCVDDAERYRDSSDQDEAVPEPTADDFMHCPRRCGVDVRNHHSTTEVNGGCDTGPMSLDDMAAWFKARGADGPGMMTTAELIQENYGKTEAQLDAEYDEICGPMA